MWTEPQSVTISGTAISLPRISSEADRSTYKSADGSVGLIVAHSYGRRMRRTARLEHQKYAPDPLFPAQNSPFSMSCYIVVDVPKIGYTATEQKAVVDGFLANLQASSGANLTKLLGGEN